LAHPWTVFVWSNNRGLYCGIRIAQGTAPLGEQRPVVS
jgi:hypothetical protein